MTHKSTLFAVVSAVALGISLVGVAPAFADDPAPGGGVQYKQKTVYDFDDDVVEGDLVRPDGEFAEVRNKAKHSSLIKIREHFIPEMLKSAEDIY